LLWCKLKITMDITEVFLKKKKLSQIQPLSSAALEAVLAARSHAHIQTEAYKTRNVDSIVTRHYKRVQPHRISVEWSMKQTVVK